MVQRATRRAQAGLVFTALEMELLARTAGKRHPRGASSLRESLLQLACLGGYLNRAGDRPPGNTVIWRGLARLTDLTIGYELGRVNCG
jgi:hypothetical protein